MDNLQEIRNYRQIKVKYISPTNYRGAKICIYEPKRYSDYKTNKIILSYCQETGCIQKQAYKILTDKGFNIICKASEYENYIFLCDNWADEFIELNK